MSSRCYINFCVLWNFTGAARS